MTIFYAVEDSDSLAVWPWYAWKEAEEGRRGYVGIAASESELLDYLAATYPGAVVSRSYADA